MIIAKLKDTNGNTLFSTCPNENEADFRESIKAHNYITLEETKIYGLADEFFNYHFPVNSQNYNLVTLEEIDGKGNEEPLEMLMSTIQIDGIIPYLDENGLKITEVIPVNDNIYNYIKKNEKETIDRCKTYNSKMSELNKMGELLKDKKITFEEAKDQLKDKIKESILELKKDTKISDETLIKMFSSISENVRNDLKNNKNIDIPEEIKDQILQEIESMITGN